MTDLIKMGYRYLGSNVWAKPVGFNLLTYTTHNKTWDNWFLNQEGKKFLWNSEQYEGEDIIGFLKSCESSTNFYCHGNSNFEFLTQKEYYEDIL